MSSYRNDTRNPMHPMSSNSRYPVSSSSSSSNSMNHQGPRPHHIDNDQRNQMHQSRLNSSQNMNGLQRSSSMAADGGSAHKGHQATRSQNSQASLIHNWTKISYHVRYKDDIQHTVNRSHDMYPLSNTLSAPLVSYAKESLIATLPPEWDSSLNKWKYTGPPEIIGTLDPAGNPQTSIGLNKEYESLLPYCTLRPPVYFHGQTSISKPGMNPVRVDGLGASSGDQSSQENRIYLLADLIQGDIEEWRKRKVLEPVVRGTTTDALDIYLATNLTQNPLQPNSSEEKLLKEWLSNPKYFGTQSDSQFQKSSDQKRVQLLAPKDISETAFSPILDMMVEANLPMNYASWYLKLAFYKCQIPDLKMTDNVFPELLTKLIFDYISKNSKSISSKFSDLNREEDVVRPRETAQSGANFLFGTGSQTQGSDPKKRKVIVAEDNNLPRRIDRIPGRPPTATNSSTATSTSTQQQQAASTATSAVDAKKNIENLLNKVKYYFRLLRWCYETRQLSRKILTEKILAAFKDMRTQPPAIPASRRRTRFPFWLCIELAVNLFLYLPDILFQNEALTLDTILSLHLKDISQYLANPPQGQNDESDERVYAIAFQKLVKKTKTFLRHFPFVMRTSIPSLRLPSIQPSNEPMQSAPMRSDASKQVIGLDKVKPTKGRYSVESEISILFNLNDLFIFGSSTKHGSTSNPSSTGGPRIIRPASIETGILQKPSTIEIYLDRYCSPKDVFQIAFGRESCVASDSSIFSSSVTELFGNKSGNGHSKHYEKLLLDVIGTQLEYEYINKYAVSAIIDWCLEASEFDFFDIRKTQLAALSLSTYMDSLKLAFEVDDPSVSFRIYKELQHFFWFYVSKILPGCFSSKEVHCTKGCWCTSGINRIDNQVDKYLRNIGKLFSVLLARNAFSLEYYCERILSGPDAYHAGKSLESEEVPLSIHILRHIGIAPGVSDSFELLGMRRMILGDLSEEEVKEIETIKESCYAFISSAETTNTHNMEESKSLSRANHQFILSEFTKGIIGRWSMDFFKDNTSCFDEDAMKHFLFCVLANQVSSGEYLDFICSLIQQERTIYLFSVLIPMAYNLEPQFIASQKLSKLLSACFETILATQGKENRIDVAIYNFLNQFVESLVRRHHQSSLEVKLWCQQVLSLQLRSAKRDTRRGASSGDDYGPPFISAVREMEFGIEAKKPSRSITPPVPSSSFRSGQSALINSAGQNNLQNQNGLKYMIDQYIENFVSIPLKHDHSQERTINSVQRETEIEMFNQALEVNYLRILPTKFDVEDSIKYACEVMMNANPSDSKGKYQKIAIYRAFADAAIICEAILDDISFPSTVLNSLRSEDILYKYPNESSELCLDLFLKGNIFSLTDITQYYMKIFELDFRSYSKPPSEAVKDSLKKSIMKCLYSDHQQIGINHCCADSSTTCNSHVWNKFIRLDDCQVLLTFFVRDLEQFFQEFTQDVPFALRGLIESKEGINMIWKKCSSERVRHDPHLSSMETNKPTVDPRVEKFLSIIKRTVSSTQRNRKIPDSYVDSSISGVISVSSSTTDNTSEKTWDDKFARLKSDDQGLQLFLRGGWVIFLSDLICQVHPGAHGLLTSGGSGSNLLLNSSASGGSTDLGSGQNEGSFLSDIGRNIPEESLKSFSQSLIGFISQKLSNKPRDIVMAKAFTEIVVSMGVNMIKCVLKQGVQFIDSQLVTLTPDSATFTSPSFVESPFSSGGNKLVMISTDVSDKSQGDDYFLNPMEYLFIYCASYYTKMTVNARTDPDSPSKIFLTKIVYWINYYCQQLQSSSLSSMIDESVASDDALDPSLKTLIRIFEGILTYGESIDVAESDKLLLNLATIFKGKHGKGLYEKDILLVLQTFRKLFKIVKNRKLLARSSKFDEQIQDLEIRNAVHMIQQEIAEVGDNISTEKSQEIMETQYQVQDVPCENVDDYLIKISCGLQKQTKQSSLFSWSLIESIPEGQCMKNYLEGAYRLPREGTRFRLSKKNGGPKLVKITTFVPDDA